MKSVFKTFVALLLAVVLVVPMAACGGSKVESVEFDRATVTMNIGDEETLAYTVFPASAAKETASWLSSDTSVATVDGGKVTALAAGEATIQVKVGGKSANCTIIVVDPSSQKPKVTNVKLDKQTITLQAGGTATLTAKISPDTAQDAPLTWTSSDEAVATVSETGVVTAVGAGRAVIRAISENNYEGYCVVNVEGQVEESKDIYVGKVEALSYRDTPFIMAMDASEIISLEAARKSQGLAFKNFDGADQDIFQTLKENGITDIRVRVWNDPKTADGTSYGGGKCDVNNAVEIAKRCQAVGLGIIVDFHYSDFWADPGKQTAPKAWQNKEPAEVAELLWQFTKDTLLYIQETGVKITMVQIGNETTDAIAGQPLKDQSGAANPNAYLYFKKGADAVRQVTGKLSEGGARVAVHFTNAGNNDYARRASELQKQGVDYDVFGTSWYPYYSSHGTLAGLTNQLQTIIKNYKKEVMVLETAYAFTQEDFDGCGNTPMESTTQPVTEQGMANAVRDVIEAIANLGDSGLGVAYWGGTWVAASTSTEGEVNRNLCKQYGCGWASAVAHDYDSDANDGGSQVDNNAFFLSDGTPLEALKLFKEVYDGHVIDVKADYLYDQELYYTVNVGRINLPNNVNVVLNNGSKLSLTPYWDIESSTLTKYIGAVNEYVVEGTTLYGGTCKVTIWVMNVNLLTGGSFEDDEGFESFNDAKTHYVQRALGDWTLTNEDHNSKEKTLQLFVSNNEGNARMGQNSFHFWDEAKVEFELTQVIKMDKLQEYGSGEYGCSFDIQGSDAETTDIYCFIKLEYNDGTEALIVKGSQAELLGWQKFSRSSLSGVEIDLTKVKTVTMGIHVVCEPSGNGPWGNIDNVQFYFEG